MVSWCKVEQEGARDGEMKLGEVFEYPSTLQHGQEGNTVVLYVTVLSLLQVQAEVGQGGQVEEQQLVAGRQDGVETSVQFDKVWAEATYFHSQNWFVVTVRVSQKLGGIVV